MASSVKCLACNKRIGREVKRYRMTFLEPGQHTILGRAVAWFCTRCGTKLLTKLTEQMSVDNE